jgi:tetratricopeptide (TPR) repeat protein
MMHNAFGVGLEPTAQPKHLGFPLCPSASRQAKALLLAFSAFILFLAPVPCHAWLNPTRDRIAEGNRLFKQGKFDDAIGKYGEALVDNPDSPLLNFNMGDANYKAGKYAEAMASYSRVRGSD